MHKFIILMLVLLLGVSFMFAQDTDYYEDQDMETEYESSDEEVGDLLLNKYVVALLCLIFMVGFYVLLLSYYPRLLDKGMSPLAAAATQCLRWSLIVALIIVLGLLALSGFSFSNFAATLANNLGFIIFIVVLWFAYLIIILSNKSKGEAK
ncbi:MAG: hypothetical protein GYA77_04560 [Candidatus Cloacimonetes bacterium]|jgi:cytochrome bd-type quinol oxidase subunit 2|nr:hypothetical protein [Candidatus Cloacimonadota bacterium]